MRRCKIMEIGVCVHEHVCMKKKKNKEIVSCVCQEINLPPLHALPFFVRNYRITHLVFDVLHRVQDELGLALEDHRADGAAVGRVLGDETRRRRSGSRGGGFMVVLAVVGIFAILERGKCIARTSM